MAYKSVNPYTLKEFNSFDFISDEELENKIELSAKAFQSWQFENFTDKSVILKKVAQLLLANKEYHANIITSEMGKPVSQSIAEVEKCALLCNYYAENAESFLVDEIKASSANKSIVRYEPMGVIYAIMPWNFPYWQVFRFIAPNFMLGNTGLLKHASNVPQCAVEMEKLFIDAGAPRGIFQNLFINYKQSEFVIENENIQGVTITGSNIAGSKVASQAGKYFKKSVLELGGSDPFIIFNDANLDLAIESAINSRFLNNGQSCIAAKRFIVQTEIYDQFIDKFVQRVKSLQCGDPNSDNVYIGPLARESFVQELDEQVNKSIEMGAKLLTGGRRYAEKSLIYLPTVIDEIPPYAPLCKEEVFGPVAPVLKFESETEAIIIANDTNFGLGATIWTDNLQRALNISREILTGTVAINGMVKSEPGLPFGGVKDSGYGRELSEIGLKEFANMKTINIF
jgi:succinate-semialdehyde dehydrogenase / glutarate-semialdehyde dehydrogenase